MKLALVTDAWSPQVNGVVNTLNRTVRELRGMGVGVEVQSPQMHPTIGCPGYPQIRLAVPRRSAIREWFDGCAPDAVHIATEGPLGYAARREALARGIPFSTAWHTRFPEYLHAWLRLPPSISYAWLRRFHAPSARVMVPTAAVCGQLAERGFRNLAVWGRGVDTHRFSPGPSGAFDGLRRPIWLSVGRLSIEKNLDAFLSLPLRGTKVVIGEGPYAATLRKRYPQAVFLGGRGNEALPHYYRAADVFVFPSRTDTFGLVLLEALACGLPVAAFPVPGPIDVINDSRAGVLDENLSAACLAALECSPEHARAQALRHSWRDATLRFASLLVPIGGAAALHLLTQ